MNVSTFRVYLKWGACIYTSLMASPLSIEKWGVKRFFVKDPNGVTVNIMCHIDTNKKAIS